MEAVVKEKKKIEPWSQRIEIEIPIRQFKRLLRTGKCATVQNYKWYKISKAPDVSDLELFDKSGKKISLSLLKKMLRKVK